MNKIVTYRCFATAVSDRSLDRQQASLNRYLARIGASASAEFVDMDVSGTTVDRPGLNALLDFCMKNPGTLMDAPHRIARSGPAFHTIDHQLSQAGAKIRMAE